MRIANNIMALNTHRQYNINNSNVAKSAEKLSSGYRVNRAGDDAAGLAISEKTRAQIRGMNMAAKNSQDGNSLIQTAEGALQEMHSVLQRMNELSVQSATGTNQTLDRNALNAEFQQLMSEVDDIASQTTFNDMNVLDGTFTNGMSLAATAGTVNTHTLKEVATARPSRDLTALTAGFTNGDSFVTLNLTGVATGLKAEIKDLVTGIDLAEGVKTGESFLVDLTTFGLGSYEITAASDMTSDNIGASIAAIVNARGTTIDDTATDESLMIQVGAKEAEQMTVGIEEMSTTTLGLTGRAIDNQDAAGRAISITRSAINQVSTVRGALGAAQNRLDHKISNLNNSVENLAAAESRIRDIDMASEMTQFTKSNVLSQAATAMLSQANALPQNILSLLK